VGYGDERIDVEWPNGANVAVNFVINYEEGSEYSLLLGDAESEAQLGEVPARAAVGARDLAIESMYEFGSRVGIWRLRRLFAEYAIPATIFASAVAFEANPAVAKALAADGHDLCAHGWRWIEQWRLPESEERQQIAWAVESLTASFGSPPLGWYCRHGPSVNTRRLVVEHEGFLYDSDTYNDELPYHVRVDARDHLVVPYSLTYNDVQGTRAPATFVDFCIRGFDELRAEGIAGRRRMMSIGLHPRLAGQAARTSALREVIRHILQFDDVWLARRSDIALWWQKHYPRDGKGGTGCRTPDNAS
jgi:peptidoglycan/xylan/chitin deacetylase (PgdA/CDA1 family)